MHPLDGSRLKIARAKTEISRLRLAEDAFLRNTRYHIVKSEFNRKSGKDVYRVKVIGSPPPPEWGVWIGEIAHNLRSALDGLVYQLVLLDGDTPTTETQFPIFLLRHTTKMKRGKRKELIHCFEGKSRGDGRNMIRFLARKHQTLIEQLQPYKHSSNSPNISLDKNQIQRAEQPTFLA